MGKDIIERERLARLTRAGSGASLTLRESWRVLYATLIKLVATEEFEDVVEYARRHGLSEAHVRRLCQRGHIPGAVRRGRAWRIPRGVSAERENALAQLLARATTDLLERRGRGDD